MPVQLRKDYERIVLSGAKRLTDTDGTPLLDAEQDAALARLIEAGLAARDDNAFVLRHPRDANDSLSDSTIQAVGELHGLWLRLGEETAAEDEVLYGDLGYWQHWWNMLNDGSDRRANPLRMDVMLSNQGSFLSRQWTNELDPQIVDHVFSEGLLDIRVIVPPASHGALAEAVIDMALLRGVQVRAFPSGSEFVVYDGSCAVVRDEQGTDELERHRLIRRRPMVEPLVHLFELRWASAIPWESFVRGTGGILQLLALGWTDVRIAEAIGSSPRTVSRRIAEMMAAAGVQSRFELGMKFALQEVTPAR